MPTDTILRCAHCEEPILGAAFGCHCAKQGAYAHDEDYAYCSEACLDAAHDPTNYMTDTDAAYMTDETHVPHDATSTLLHD